MRPASVLDGCIPHSVSAIAPFARRAWRERIRQIEAKVLRKLRHPSRSEQLRSFLIEE